MAKVLRFKTRKLLNGERVQDEEFLINLVISTKAPRKWLFVDLETGNIWRPRMDRGYRNHLAYDWEDASGMVRIVSKTKRKK